MTNQGSGKATFVKISGAFYNSSNSVVAADFTYADPKDLEPGQTAPFEIIVNGPTANKITSALLNVDSNQYSSIDSQVVLVSPNVKSGVISYPTIDGTFSSTGTHHHSHVHHNSKHKDTTGTPGGVGSGAAMEEDLVAVVVVTNALV